MQKFFHGKSKSENLPQEANDSPNSSPSSSPLTSFKMNFGRCKHSADTMGTLRETQAALSAAMESISLKDKIISSLEEEIKAQEDKIVDLRKELKKCKAELENSAKFSTKLKSPFPLFGNANPEKAYPDLSFAPRPKRMAISAEPQLGGDSLPSAPTPVLKTERLVC